MQISRQQAWDVMQTKPRNPCSVQKEQWQRRRNYNAGTTFFHIFVDNVPSKVVRRAHTRELGAHINVSSKNDFCTYFIHIIPNLCKLI